MVEGTFRSVDPFAYYVNNLEEFDRDIVAAYKRKDNETLKRLAALGKSDYDIFICVSKNWHGFVLCVPAAVDPQFKKLTTDVIKSPFDVPDLILCYVFELCYDNQQMRTYKIQKQFTLFKNIRERIGSRSYFIGHYEQIGPSAFQLAAIRAAPHRYNVLLNDCVEFSKEFCIQALAYSSNWKDIESEVNENIKKASATGFSAEQLSRRVKSSAWLGNISLGGTDMSSIVSNRNPNAVCCFLVVFLLLYPIIVVVVILKLYNIK